MISFLLWEFLLWECEVADYFATKKTTLYE